MPIEFDQRPSCPVCAASATSVLVELPYDEPPLREFIESFYRGRLPIESISGHSYRVVQCDHCDMIYQDPILDRAGMHLLYDKWVDQDASLAKKQRKLTQLRRQSRGQLRTLERIFRPPPAGINILEFGMGWGYWSQEASQLGFDVSGYELSPRRREHAIELGVEAITQLPTGTQFDCIYANQVFEHLPEPKQTLTALCACLNPAGVIYLRVPDGRLVASRLRRHGWSPDLDAIHPLEHVNCFTRKTLIRLAAEIGLTAFNPPPRINPRRIWGGIKREFADRFVTTHLYFKRA